MASPGHSPHTRQQSSREMARPEGRGYPHSGLTTPRALCRQAKPGLLLQPKAQVAHDQAEAKRARRARNNSLLTGPGMAGPSTGSLAARITMAPATGVAGPSATPILGAPPLANPSAPLPAVSTSMDVDYGNPLTDPLSEGNDIGTSSRHEDLDVPVSM